MYIPIYTTMHANINIAILMHACYSANEVTNLL